MNFEFYDPDVDTTVHYGHLPHWFQNGATYFITYRLADSVPVTVHDALKAGRDNWLSRHGLSSGGPAWREQLKDLPGPIRKAYHIRYTDAFHDVLDQSYGACYLRSPELSAIVAGNLHHFDGARYDLAAFVVMPNHVHVLVGFRDGVTPVDQCYSWKKFTATGMNRKLGRSGRFWQDEGFDHIVRSEAHFWYYRDYIANNPRKAGLKPDEYRLYLPSLHPHTACADHTQEVHTQNP
jgi:putative transposase